RIAAPQDRIAAPQDRIAAPQDRIAAPQGHIPAAWFFTALSRIFKRIWGNQFPQTPSQRLHASRQCACEFR
ncbi:MAG: hypothetical protein LBD13_05210, partial [Spirochaetaceae bacterium]|nr:hypothetical protein [Spirochaetaceae bacterium]